MTDQDAPPAELSGKPRRATFVLALALAFAAAIVAGAVVFHNQAPKPAPAVPTEAGAPAHPAAPPAKAAPKAVPPQDRKHSLPELVPGSPLDDDRFAQLSAAVVIGAMGLKHDADWETHVLLYMQKVLDKAGVSVAEYSEYAGALRGQPDRARAVAENIMMRVEKKLGYRVSMDKLPMFKFDEKTIKQLEKKLQR